MIRLKLPLPKATLRLEHMTPIGTAGIRSKVFRASLMLGAVVTVWACDDPLKARADQTNTNQTFAVSAISGTPTNAPVALNLVNKSITRLDGGFDFDIAFDINAQGQAIILPVGLVGTPFGGAKLVGLKRVAGTYETVTEAPKSGYVFDSTMVVAAGSVLAIQAQENICRLSLTPYIFAKIAIDSVNKTTRTLYGHTLINLNCGFRSLVVGTPSF